MRGVRVALVHKRQAAVGGTERYLDQVAAGLVRRGHEVTLVCHSHERLPEGVRCVTLPILAVGARWRASAFARAVERHVGRAGYDLVYGLGKTWTHDVVRLGGGSVQTWFERVHPPGYPPSARERRLHEIALDIERRALAPGACLRVIANSEMVRRDVMARRNLPAERVTVVRNGVDLARFDPDKTEGPGRELRGALGVPASAFVILFLGSGFRRKGLDLLLDALPSVAAHREVHCLVVGADADGSGCEQRIRGSAIDPFVHFLGVRRDVEVCCAAADVLALPTRYDASANATLEALASGLPAITTASDGASEVVEEGQTGSVLPAEPDVGSLRAALLWWAVEGRARAAAATCRAVAERNSQERTIESSIALLEEVHVEKKARRAR